MPDYRERAREAAASHAGLCSAIDALHGIPNDNAYDMVIKMHSAAIECARLVPSLLAGLEAAEITELPTCSGNWIGGSGGHRTHEPCGRIATWWRAGDSWAYCDEHIKEHERGTPNGYPPAPWAALAKERDELKGLLASAREQLQQRGCYASNHTKGGFIPGPPCPTCEVLKRIDAALSGEKTHGT